jgi:hypothetical protein
MMDETFAFIGDFSARAKAQGLEVVVKSSTPPAQLRIAREVDLGV